MRGAWFWYVLLCGFTLGMSVTGLVFSLVLQLTR